MYGRMDGQFFRKLHIVWGLLRLAPMIVLISTILSPAYANKLHACLFLFILYKLVHIEADVEMEEVGSSDHE